MKYLYVIVSLVFDFNLKKLVLIIPDVIFMLTFCMLKFGTGNSGNALSIKE